MRKILPVLIGGLFASFLSLAQPTTFTNCPGENLAIARTGNNSNTSNPESIYRVDPTTGATSLISGPILDPANGSNLQINGLGLNTQDGFLYGLNTLVPFSLTPATSFYRVGANAQAEQVGTLSGPAITAPANASIVNSAAGETDQSGNYYFTAATGTVTGLFFSINKLYLGRLPALASLPAGTAALSPVYTEITSTDPNVAAYLASLFSATNVATAQNTGLKDFIYNKADNKLYTYVTFPDPSNPANYLGQLLILNPATGVLTSVAPAAVFPPGSASVEVAGTLIDQSGNLLVLFTNGDMYKANTTAPNMFDGSLSLLGNSGLPTASGVLRGDMASCGSVRPTTFTNCPGENLAIARTGNNSNTSNPESIYRVDPTTGATSLISGPILDPANGSNLQINGLGLNTQDGYLYGLNTLVPFSLTPATSFYRVGANAQAEQVGTISGPAVTAPANASIVNSAAGETDQSGNYYFTAATGTVTGLFFSINKLYLGRLPAVASLPAGTGALSPVYTEITSGDPNVATYLASLFSATNVATAQNTGLKDFIYNKADNKLYTYVTFPDPSNPANYLGQLLILNPATGVLTSVAPAVVFPPGSASVEVAGTLLDQSGNLLVLFTNGDMYKANTTAPNVFDGSVSLLGNSGLPTASGVLRGDMASCGNGMIILPVTLTSFSAAYTQNDNVLIKWETSSELNADKFIVQRSADGVNWTNVTTVQAKGNTSQAINYEAVDNNVLSTTYYRLVMVDIDGQQKLSPVRRVVITATGTFKIYPNPVRNKLIIEAAKPIVRSASLSTRIIDVSGKVYNLPVSIQGNSIITINTSQLSTGSYFIQLLDADGKALILQKFIKQ